MNPELAVTNPAWGQATGGSSAMATVDLGSNLGSVSTTIAGDYYNDLVWDTELEEYIETTIYPTIELTAFHAAEGSAIDIYARVLSDNPTNSNLEYWVGADAPVEFSVSSNGYSFVTSVSIDDDTLAGGDQTVTIYFGNDDSQQTTSLQATVFDNEVLVAFDAAVHSATEGDDVLLAIAANFPQALEYRVEDVTALQPGKYSGPTSWTAVGNTSTVAIPTYHTSGYDGVLSFKIVLRVAGDATTEVVLEADIYDLIDTTIQSVDYAYDTFNQLVRRTHDADGSVGAGSPTERFFSWEGGQIALQFDGTEASDLSHRYLNGPAVDQIMADEVVTSLGNPGETLWGLADHLGTIRDVATHDVVTHATSIANHRVFDSFGILISQTNANFSIAFGFTGVYFDTATTLQFHRNRWYDPATGRWLSEDPIGFAGGDPNLSRYVANSPTDVADPSGLEGIDFGEIHQQAWDTASSFYWGMVQAGGNPMMYLMQQETSQNFADAREVWNNSAPNYSMAERAYMAGGLAAANSSGIRGLSDMCSSRDAVRGHRQSGMERALDGINGAGRLSAVAGAGVGMLRSIPMQAEVLPVHGNSLQYVGDTHVYAIRGPQGVHKIGQSMQGIRKSDGASIRGEAQVRALQRKTGQFYKSEIRGTFPDKKAACEYETKIIDRFRRMFGNDMLPGNKTNR